MKTVALAMFAFAALTASSTSIGAHPAYTRVVVTFTGGTLQFGEVEASDPSTAGGSVRVRVRHPGVRAAALPVSGDGVRAVVAGAPNRVSANLSYGSGRYKYLAVSVLHSPERLVLDLYRSRPPAPPPRCRSGAAAVWRSRASCPAPARCSSAEPSATSSSTPSCCASATAADASSARRS